jgi:hypothetical protein
MTDLTFTDLAPLTGTRMTADGYMVAEVRCARTGCQDYMASDLGIMGGGVVTVYRPEEVVFDKASLATFAGKPVTMGHPTDPVTADNWKTHAIGDIGTEIARDGEYVRVPIKLMDAVAIQAVIDGTREISMGYTTGMKLEDGVAPDGTKYHAVQTGPIRINHLAVVPRARGGSSLRIGDGATARWGASPIIDRKDATMADAIQTRTVLIDGLSVVTTDAGAQALEKLQKTIADMAKKAEEMEEDKDKKLAAKDAEIAKKDAALADAQAKILDAAAIDKLVADRADLVARAKTLHPAVVTDGKSPSEIKRAVVVAKRGAEMADKSEAYIDAAFDLLGDAVDPVKAALADAKAQKLTDREAMYAKRDADLANAWKTQKVEA